jgi:hypothetical protein
MASPNVPANTLSPAFSTGIPNIFDRFAPRATNASESASNVSTVFGPAVGIFGDPDAFVVVAGRFVDGFLAGLLGAMTAMLLPVS